MALLTGDFYTDLLAISVGLLAVLAAYFKWSFGYWKRKGVSGPAPTIPFGNAGPVIFQKQSFGEGQQSIYDEYKAKGLPYCSYYFFTKPILVLFDPDMIRDIMTKDFQHFTDHGNYVNEKDDPLSGHLFSLGGLKWKNLRQKLTPTFTSGKMKMMFQTLVDCSDDLVVILDQSVKENEAVDIKEVVARFTTDIIGSCAFGIECNSLRDPNAEFRSYGKKVFEIDTVQALKNFASLCLPNLLKWFRIPLTRKDVNDFFMKVVKETVKYREKNNVVRKDFMHLLIQLKNNVKVAGGEEAGQLKGTDASSEVGKTLTIDELAAQAFVFFLAGFETSSTTLTFCFYELVQNPEIQERLRQEINAVLDKHGGKITYNAMMDMAYMDRCINETLRKYPPVPILTRECTQTYTFKKTGLTVEKGNQLFLPILGIQNDPEHYPNPERFDPDRFLPEIKAKRHAFTWLPFGDGPRACIGLRFGVMQTKVALTVLLKNYRFKLNPKTKMPMTLEPKSFVMSVDGGVWLTTEKI